MRLVASTCVLALVLSGCATSLRQPKAVDLPLDIGGGIGSQFGNYEMRPAGETRDAKGNRCEVFNWDRPLNRNFAVRYSSESCESKEHPIWMNTTPYIRKVIPIAESNLTSAQ